jgi:hypothetical protein
MDVPRRTSVGIFHHTLFPKVLAETSAQMLQLVRWIQSQQDIPPSRIWNFDEVRIYSSPQDLNSHTLQFASVRDPMVRKVANPKEAFTGIIMANGDGENLMVFLVTKKALPANSIVHTITVEDRTWKDGQVKVTPVTIPFAVIHGITVLKVPPGSKAWCSSIITQAMLQLSLFRVDSPSLLQVFVARS